MPKDILSVSEFTLCHAQHADALDVGRNRTRRLEGNMMVKKADVLTAAALLVKEHGEDAWLEASSKASDHKAAGDAATSQFWAHVADAIAAMSGQEAAGTPSYKQ